mmetsp:Transcript_39982/g.58796  ORF Transcript_39982/g.58796 Transcript_39982/m.58796 type:complete len:380 (+) Transcript_39982:105-1244(+)|eukprot:CAMPEP_0195512930 /NCGR_PEP_ID=MMETSP0794_2-20130614/4722_1 /TAXON_ID=515487 /ORGANISM="Stephanopyxis turris, Strain CCMP 815" /LENGTH=379 /DNA_ID=CAMNT_0040640825 /DNA_START=102 /DNA_END=1241 /DNA_ORIENTATION=+
MTTSKMSTKAYVFSSAFLLTFLSIISREKTHAFNTVASPCVPGGICHHLPFSSESRGTGARSSMMRPSGHRLNKFSSTRHDMVLKPSDPVSTPNERSTTSVTNKSMNKMDVNFPELFKGMNVEQDMIIDETSLQQEYKAPSSEIPFLGGGVALVLLTAAAFASQHPAVLSTVEHFFTNPTAVLEGVVAHVETMGSTGYLYFGLFYTLCEILAIPAIPLTASAGYLFGVKEGTAVVLLSASIAAAISFLIGRTFLRDYVEKALEDYPRFKALDKAIGEEGFKLMLILRLSPIFPFALSNYLYGVTSVKFWPYFWGTMLGFTPGTIAYVYTGEIGKALTIDAASSEPWYFYAGILAAIGAGVKVLADVATNIINELEETTE